MEIKQYSSEVTMGQGWNRGRSKRRPKIQWKWSDNIPKFMGHNKSSVKRKIHSTKCLHKKAGKIPH